MYVLVKFPSNLPATKKTFPINDINTCQTSSAQGAPAPSGPTHNHYRESCISKTRP